MTFLVLPGLWYTNLQPPARAYIYIYTHTIERDNQRHVLSQWRCILSPSQLDPLSVDCLHLVAVVLRSGVPKVSGSEPGL